MTDRHDDFDRRLTERLGATEHRVPGANPPPARVPERRTLRWVVAGTATAAALIVGILAFQVLRDPEVADASPTVVPTGSSPVASAPQTPPAVTASPDPTPTPVPTPAPISNVEWMELSWDEESVPATVTYDDITGLWIAGAGRAIWTSPDARSWTRVDDLPSGACGISGGCTGGEVEAIVRIGDRLYALGSQGTPAADVFEIVTWVSDDAAVWTLADLPQAFVGQHSVAAAVNGRVLATLTAHLTSPEAGTTALATSTGRSWTGRDVIGSIKLVDIVADGDGFVASGSAARYVSSGDDFGIELTPKVMGSADGHAWSEVSTGLPGAGALLSIARSAEGRLVAVGVTGDGDVLTWAANGREEPWTVRSLSVGGGIGVGFEHVQVLALPAGLVLVANTEAGVRAWTSVDGETWQQAAAPAAAPDRAVRSIAGHGDLVVAFAAARHEAGGPPSDPPFSLLIGRALVD